MKAQKSPDARRGALAALAAVLDDGRSLAEAGPLAEISDGRDRAFARRLAYGVLRWLGALEWLTARLLDRPLRRKDRDIQRLLLLGLYQLWIEDTADHAAVHATAQCARGLGKPWAVALVNAVLRRFQRERQTLLAELSQSPDRHAHPAWLLDSLRQDWPDHWEAVVSANNLEPPLWLRCNRLRTDRETLAARLRAEGFEVQLHAFAPEALRIEPAASVSDIPGFMEGMCSVQDPAAQLAAHLLSPGPGQRVLDACAAPGGKTGHLLELEPDIRLTAVDLQPDRAGMIGENLDRLGLSADVLVADAARPEDWWDGTPYHRILLDAPCSATGVIRRHPEIKWLRTPEQVAAGTATQAGLLGSLWPLLAPGGMLVYATCSVLKRENSEQIHRFIERHDDAVPTLHDPMPGRKDPPGQQILPGEEHMDGFFYALVRRSDGAGAGADHGLQP